MFNSVLIRKLRHLLPNFFPIGWQPAYVGAWGCSSYISPCWSSGGSCQPISPACWGPSEVSTTPPCCVSSAKLLRVQSAPWYKLLMKVLNRTGPSRDFWSYTTSFWSPTRLLKVFNHHLGLAFRQFSICVLKLCIYTSSMKEIFSRNIPLFPEDFKLDDKKRLCN